MKRRVWPFILGALAALAVAAAPLQQRNVTYQRYDVVIDVQRDGSLLVTETYELRFEGEFRTGFAEIPLDNVTDIVDVTVREGERPYVQGGYATGTFTLERGYDAIRVNWEYEATSGTEVRTFTVAYRVLGGLWVYPDFDWLMWQAVPADRSGIPTEASKVTVRLPAPVDEEQLVVNSRGIDATATVVDATTVVFESRGSLRQNTAFEVEVGFPHGMTSAGISDWQKRADETAADYRWTDVTVDLAVAQDGSVTVHERHALDVKSGYLYSGYRIIPWLYLDGIESVSVESAGQSFQFSSSPCESCYVVEEKPRQPDWVLFDGEQVVIDSDRAGVTLVEWSFPPLGAGDTGAFDLRYSATGAVRVLSDTQEINWTVVFADRGVPVEGATLNVTLPPSVAPDQITISGGTPTVRSDDVLQVHHDGPVPEGRPWSVLIQMPPGTTAAKKPIWQQQLEQQLRKEQAHFESAQQAAVRTARWQVALGALGCLFPILGLAGVVAAWYVWGRDRAAPPVAAYLTEPPSDLPPGIVAYLVDEEPTVKGVLADLLRLATLGLISVDLQKEDFLVQLNWPNKLEDGETFRVGDGEPVALSQHERTLFNLLVERITELGAGTDQVDEAGQRPVAFSKIQRAFLRELPTIYEQMGKAAAQYFSVLPETARRRWTRIGQAVVVAAITLGLAALCSSTTLGWPALAPPVGLMVVGLMFMGASRWMPQRTTLGIEEAAKWRAFRRYLKNLKQFGDLEDAQVVLDDHFPYAVALGVDEIVLRQAEKMDAQVPIWMVPVPVQVGPPSVAPRSQRSLRDLVEGTQHGPASTVGDARPVEGRPSPTGRPAGANLSLQGLSDNLSRSLNNASRSLSSLLNTAAGRQDDIDSPVGVREKGASEATQIPRTAGTSTMKILSDILKESSSGGGGGGFSGGSFRSSSWGGSRSRSSSSSSRRSGGGGSRGFG